MVFFLHIEPLVALKLLASEVGNWVITRVCKQIAEWQSAGKGPFQVAVNVSGQQIIEGDFRPLPIKELEDFLRERQCFT